MPRQEDNSHDQCGHPGQNNDLQKSLRLPVSHSLYETTSAAKFRTIAGTHARVRGELGCCISCHHPSSCTLCIPHSLNQVDSPRGTYLWTHSMRISRLLRSVMSTTELTGSSARKLQPLHRVLLQQTQPGKCGSMRLIDICSKLVSKP